MEVRQTEAAKVVFVEHRGAYWSIGPQLSQVRDYMIAHGQPGPLFVRYLDDPATASPNDLRTQIGLFVNRGHQPEEPYHVATLDPETIVSVTIDLRDARPMRFLARLREWTEDHGYLAVGPVTEIYLKDSPAGEGRPLIELRIKVQPTPAQQEPSSLVRDATFDTSKTTGWKDAAVALPSSDDAEREMPGHVDGFVMSGDIGSAAAFSDAGGIDAGHPDNCVVDSARGVSSGSISNQLVGEDGADCGLVEVSAGIPQRDSASIETLLKQRRFDEIAETLLPPAELVPQYLRVWLGQVVLRVSAAAKGARKVRAQDDDVLAILARALSDRYAAVYADSAKAALDQSTVYIESASDPLALDKRALMRDLDSLLGKMAFDTVDYTDTLNSLLGILDRVRLVVDWTLTGPRSGPRAGSTMGESG